MKRFFAIFISLLTIGLFFETLEVQAQPSNRQFQQHTYDPNQTYTGRTYTVLTNFDGYVRIKASSRANYAIHIENGKLEAGIDVNPDWWSAMWEIIPVEGTTEYVHIRNRWKSTHYLHVANGEALTGPVSDTAALETMWKIETDGIYTYIRTRVPASRGQIASLSINMDTSNNTGEVVLGGGSILIQNVE